MGRLLVLFVEKSHLLVFLGVFALIGANDGTKKKYNKKHIYLYQSIKSGEFCAKGRQMRLMNLTAYFHRPQKAKKWSVCNQTSSITVSKQAQISYSDVFLAVHLIKCKREQVAFFCLRASLHEETLPAGFCTFKEKRTYFLLKLCPLSQLLHLSVDKTPQLNPGVEEPPRVWFTNLEVRVCIMAKMFLWNMDEIIVII